LLIAAGRAIVAAMSKTAVVTGATGFVGLNLIEELLEQGWRVTAMRRRDSDLTCLERHDAGRVLGDVTDAASVGKAMPTAIDWAEASGSSWACRRTGFCLSADWSPRL